MLSKVKSKKWKVKSSQPDTTMRIRWVVLLAAMLVAGCRSSIPNEMPVSDAQNQTYPAAFLPDVTSRVLTSSASNRRYQISVALPDGYTKDHAPYPVLYAADANAQFGTVVETARLLSFSKQIPDIVIVGIGYANAGQGFKASGPPRALDLTPTEDQVWVEEFGKESLERGVAPPESSGGAPKFLRFVRDELIPSIEGTYHVNRSDRTWYGHSFGGLFGVYLLFNANDLFNRFIIGSPSLWWDKRAMLAAEDAFAATKKPLHGRAFLSVGVLERQLAPKYPMVTDLREFATRLQRRNYEGFQFQTHFFEDENHLSVVPATISRGLRFVYASAANPALQPSAPVK
jgi:uncharacterized protein